MKAAVLYQPNDLRIEEIARPVPDADQVLVRIKAVGICGSDLHFYRDGRIGKRTMQRPFVLGHEAAGEIVEMGSSVTGLRVGQRVAIEPGIYCRKCAFCQRGEYNNCPNVIYPAIPHNDGYLAEYAAAPAENIYPLPDSLDFIEGAMLEPLAVGLQGTAEGQVQAGQSVAITGAGPIGLYTLQAAKARGATNVIVVDIIDSRLQMATKLGATAVVDGRQTAWTDEVVRLTGGLGADVVIETAGATSTMQETLLAARQGGTIVQVGLTQQPSIPLDFWRLIARSLTLKGSFRYAKQYALAVALAAAGLVDLRSPVTHVFDFSRLVEAMELSDTRKDVAIKVAVTL